MFGVFVEIFLILVLFTSLMFWINLSSRLGRMERKLFDKSKIKYTDGDNT